MFKFSIIFIFISYFLYAVDLKDIEKLLLERKYESVITRLLQYNELDANLYNVIGACFYMLGNNENAKIYYKKALKLKKYCLPALMNLLIIYIENRELENILDISNKLILRYPEYYYGYFSKAYYEFLNGKYEKAKALIEKAKSILPKKDKILNKDDFEYVKYLLRELNN